MAIYCKKPQDQHVTMLSNVGVEHIFSFFVPDNSLLVFPDAIIKENEPHENISNVVFDCCTNPIDITKKLKEISLSKFKILTGLLLYHKNIPYDNVYFFPFWIMWMSLQQFTFSNNKKKYKLSCLNGTPWAHRKLAYLEFSNKLYFKDIIFTFKNNLSYVPLPTEINLTDKENKKIASLPPVVLFSPADNDGIDLSINHPAFQETYINVVTETTVSNIVPMLSEKTFKPIVAGQLFLLIASPNSIQFLREIGIDTFDDIIDHSYDNEINVRQRITKVFNEIDRLMLLDLESVYLKIKDRLYQNSTYFNSIEFRKQFILPF